jgi:cysteine desulfurase/selenocysteine lyase
MFPITSTNQIYFNHASIAPYCNIHQTAMKEYYYDRSQNDVEYVPKLMQNNAELKSLIGELINGSPENISFVQNTTDGLNILVEHLEWNPGDEIVIYRKDFPANVYPFLKLEKHGVVIRIVEDENTIFNSESYIDLINERTRLVTVSYVQFLTGQVANLKAISNACVQNDCLFVVDTIQGLGAIQLDVNDLKIDFISNGGHKWMLFPMGLGYAYFSDRLKEKFIENRAGWLNRENPFDLFNWQNPLLTDGGRFDFGGYSLLSIFISKHIMEFRKKIGENIIEERVISNSSYLRQKLMSIGTNVIGDEAEFQSGIVSFRHESTVLLEELKNNNITIANREGIYRVSPHFYNTSDEIDAFIDILRKYI